jgi:predicted branched-subunit amino acid permease
MLPWLVAVTPFGLVIGVSASQASISTAAGWFTGPTIYGGSAQVAAIQLLDGGAAAIPVIATVLVINLRLVLYGAALAPYWRGTPLWWRLLAGYLLVDPSFVIAKRRYDDQRSVSGTGADRGRAEAGRAPAHAFYLGGAVVLWVGWLAALGVGAVAGAAVPPGLHLELLVPLYLVGQILPELRRRVTRRAVVVSGAVAVACLAAPLHLGIAIGIVAGLLVAALGAKVGRPGSTATPALSTQEVA